MNDTVMTDFKPLFKDLSFTDKPMVIAGPCSAESESQTLETAAALHELGVPIFRAGIWKPRTKPGGFEGVGTKGLKWLQAVKTRYGMKVATEVATPRHIEQALAHEVDLLWIGARTVTNPFAMQAIANALQGVDIPVLVKNPVMPDVNLWIGGLERLYRSGIERLGAIHRGFMSSEKSHYRNEPHWHIPIELRRELPGLPIICDPSHIGGRRDLIEALCQEALALRMDGLIIETHINPECALSDAQQQITPSELGKLLNQLEIGNLNESDATLHGLRIQIDAIDQHILEALARRMSLSKEIGEYKQKQKLTILQPERYRELLDERCENGEALGLNKKLVKALFEAIHEESVRLQLEQLKHK